MLQLRVVRADDLPGRKVKGSVPVFQAKDETVVRRVLRFDERFGELVGQCEHDPVIRKAVYPVPVYKADSYESIVAAHGQQTNCATYEARVIMFNPAVYGVAARVAFLIPTCGAFTAKDVEQQWDLAEQMVNQQVDVSTGKGTDVVNTSVCFKTNVGPIVKRASDGDAKRRSLMIRLLSSGGLFG